MKNKFTTLAFIFILTNVQAQSGFEKVYGGDSPDYFRAVIGTSDGGILAAGGSNSFMIDSSIYPDGYIVKVNSIGDTLWTRRFGDIYTDRANAAVENDSGYLITGWYIDALGTGKFYAVQYDENGNKLWENFYASGYSNDILTDNNGDNILCGGFYTGSSYDYYVIKTDPGGNQITSANFGGAGFDWPASIIQTSDGGYAMTGYSNSAASDYDIYIVKADNNFVFQWAHNYGSALDDYGYDLAEDANGNLWILGSLGTPDTSHMVLIKTDANGDNAVMKFPGTTEGDFGYKLQSLNSGGFLIGGVGGAFGKGDEMLLEKLNVNGDTVWTKHFGGTKNEFGYAVGIDANNNILLAGETEGFGVNKFDAYLVKLDSAGEIPCPASVSFVSSNDSVCEDESLTFTNTTVSSQQFSWSENGNNFSNDADAFFYFGNSGNYNIMLTACSDSYSQNITVNPKPPTHFTYFNSGSDASFMLDAAIDVQFISWNFGDGSPLNTTDINPTHTYPAIGSYWVILSITDNHGCDSTFIEQIILYTGIDEAAKNSFNLFPNPADVSVMLQSSSPDILPVNIVMMNVVGTVVKEFTLRRNQESIYVGDLLPGIYFLKVMDLSDGNNTMKLEVY